MRASTSPKQRAVAPSRSPNTRDEVRDLLEGFSIVSITQDHIFPYIVEDYIEHRYTAQPYFQTMPKLVFRALERNLGWHLLVVASPTRQ